jgi:hypothetical protein
MTQSYYDFTELCMFFDICLVITVLIITVTLLLFSLIFSIFFLIIDGEVITHWAPSNGSLSQAAVSLPQELFLHS